MTKARPAPIVFFIEGRTVPAARFRVLQFLPNLNADGITYHVCESRPAKYLWHPSWLRSRTLQLIWAAMLTAWLFTLRFVQILRYVPKSRAVFLQRDLLFRFPSAVLESLIVKLAHQRGGRVVFDIDDAIYLTPAAPLGGTLAGKIRNITQAVDVTLCGNQLLEEKMKADGGSTAYVPTVVDTDLFVSSPTASPDVITIGWIGVAGNLSYLAPLEKPLNALALKAPFRVVLVTNNGALSPFQAPAFPVELRDWSAEREVADIQSFDIGIMPLPDTPWARGKCGFKLLQYMATGLPTVASAVGANTVITEHGVTGLLAETPEDWQSALEKLLQDAELRTAMGVRARARVEAAYSLEGWYPRWKELVAKT